MWESLTSNLRPGHAGLRLVLQVAFGSKVTAAVPATLLRTMKLPTLSAAPCFILPCFILPCSFVALLALSLSGSPWEQRATAQQVAPAEQSTPVGKAERKLFWEGDRLEDWTVTEFGSQREVKSLEGGGFEIEAGYPLSGVHSTHKDWPRANYELEWEFQRVEGNDFPCCLTFPVADSHCSVVIGGWGGTLVGLSCLDGNDAAHNETAKHLVFENGKWYRARLQVDADQIRFWIDDREVITQDLKGKRVSVRNEVQLSRPLGICSFETTTRIRQFRLYQLSQK